MGIWQRALLAASAVAVAPILFLACGSAANEGTGGAFGTMRISAVQAWPAGRGGLSRLVLSIENAGVDHVVVQGVELSAAAGSRIVGSLGRGRVGMLGPLTLAAGETIDFDGKKLWIEVGPLTSELAAGQTLEGRLLVGSVKAPIAIVVSAPDSSDRSARDSGKAASSTGSIAHSRGRGCLPV